MSKQILKEIEYLAHVIDEYGLHPTKEKVKTIKEAPQPHNVMSSGNKHVTSKSTITFMEVAITTMELTTFGFCWTIYEAYVCIWS